MVKTLDNLWSAIVRKRINKCEICGKSDGVLQAHHIQGRSPQILRWNLDNGICLCSHCHTFGQVSAHSTSYSGQKEFHRLLVQLKGERALNRLGEIREKTHKLTGADLEERIDRYKEILTSMDKDI